MLELNDQQLVAAYLHGDEQSLEILIKKYLKPIYNFVAHYVGDGIEAEDLTQEIFVKTWRNLKKFDQTKNFKSWLYAVAKNTALDYFKKKKAIPFSGFETEDGENLILNNIVDSAVLPDEVVARKEFLQKLERGINNLSPLYRLIFNLRYEKQLTFREIATKLNSSIDTVKSRYRRALARLRDALGKIEL